MAQITWNNVAAPNLGESNSLFAQAIASLKDAGAGLKDTAKDYQTVVRNKSHAILQDYINSAKTPEELQSEAFNTGFKNLQATLANEYDAVKVNDYRDSAVDKLTKRAGDAVALERNQFGLTNEKKAVAIKDAMANLYTITDPIARKAEETRLAQLGLLDAAAAQSYKVGEQSLAIGQDTIDTNAKTFDARVLAPQVNIDVAKQNIKASQAGVVNAQGVLDLQRQQLAYQKQRDDADRLAKAAEASGKNGFTSAQGEAATTTAIANIRKIEGDALAGVSDKFTYRDMDAVDKEVLKGEYFQKWMPSTAKVAKEIIEKTPELAGLPNPVKAAIYKGIINKVQEDNVFGKHDWINQNREKYFNFAIDTAKANTGYIAKAQQQVAVATQDFAIQVNRMSGKAPNDPFGFRYAQEQIGTSRLTEYGNMSDVLDKINKGEIKQPTAPQPAVAATLNTGGTGAASWFQPKQQQTTAPVVTATAKDVQNSTYMKSPLQVVADAVTPKLTPLLPAANQNAFKDKANNLSIDTGTGKTTPAKNPVAIPDVTWGKPTQVVTMSPLVAKLPQYKAVATFVPDGDTFSAKSDSYATKGEKAKKAGGILCRVDSVDAPETPHLPYKRGQPYGEEAGKKLQQMILNKEISIRIVKPANGDPNEVGHYGRDICQIEVSGANVSTELIRSGAAWLYKEYNNYFTGLEAVQADAQANQRGLFGLPNPVYPPTAKHSGSLNLQ